MIDWRAGFERLKGRSSGPARGTTAPDDDDDDNDQADDKGREWIRIAIAVFGLVMVAGFVGLRSYQRGETSAITRANQEIVSTGVECELTSGGVPGPKGVGFVVKAQCPDGAAHLEPSLFLWAAVIDALPPDKRSITCSVRRDGKYTDCKKGRD